MELFSSLSAQWRQLPSVRLKNLLELLEECATDRLMTGYLIAFEQANGGTFVTRSVVKDMFVFQKQSWTVLRTRKKQMLLRLKRLSRALEVLEWFQYQNCRIVFLGPNHMIFIAAETGHETLRITKYFAATMEPARLGPNDLMIALVVGLEGPLTSEQTKHLVEYRRIPILVVDCVTAEARLLDVGLVRPGPNCDPTTPVVPPTIQSQPASLLSVPRAGSTRSFFDLPLEIRRQVYDYVFCPEYFQLDNVRTRRGPPGTPLRSEVALVGFSPEESARMYSSLLRVNRQMRAEVLEQDNFHRKMCTPMIASKTSVRSLPSAYWISAAYFQSLRFVRVEMDVRSAASLYHRIDFESKYIFSILPGLRKLHLVYDFLPKHPDDPIHLLSRWVPKYDDSRLEVTVLLSEPMDPAYPRMASPTARSFIKVMRLPELHWVYTIVRNEDSYAWMKVWNDHACSPDFNYQLCQNGFLNLAYPQVTPSEHDFRVLDSLVPPARFTDSATTMNNFSPWAQQAAAMQPYRSRSVIRHHAPAAVAWF